MIGFHLYVVIHRQIVEDAGKRHKVFVRDPATGLKQIPRVEKQTLIRNLVAKVTHPHEHFSKLFRGEALLDRVKLLELSSSLELQSVF